MGKLVGAYIFPHPPIIIPEIGRGEEQKASATVNACVQAAKEIAALKPDTIIITTPHGPVFEDAVCISVESRLEGSFNNFRRPDVRFEFENDSGLVKKIIAHSEENNIQVGRLDSELAKSYRLSKQLDHGALVPLYYAKREIAEFKLVHISPGFLPFEELYLFGNCIAKAVEEHEGNVVFIASGDLSHRLTRSAPAGYDPRGAEYDNTLVGYVNVSQVENIIHMDRELMECAGECGLRSFIIMYGALDGKRLESKVLSYEGPFGVGYCIASIKPGESSEDRRLTETLFLQRDEAVKEIRSGEDPYVALARITLETYVTTGRTIRPDPLGLPDEMLRNRAGVFVSIKKHGQLRGCIGTVAPTRKSIADEIVYNAISAGTKDPRFYPVEANELKDLVYSVDVLKKPEPIKTKEELDPVKYGVIVRSGFRSGLLLPNLEGVKTVEEQVSIALQKAGIRPDEKYTMERFEVVRHK